MTTTIDIRNNAAVHSFIVAKLTRLGWKVDSNAKVGNKLWSGFPNWTPQFFALSYQYKSMTWVGTEGQTSKLNMLADVIETMEDAMQLMEFVEQNADMFVEDAPFGGLAEGKMNMIVGGGSSHGKSLYQAVTAAKGMIEKSMEIANKTDTVIGITKSVTPPASLKHVSWNIDELDAMMGSICQSKISAALDKAMEEAYEKHYKKYFDAWYDKQHELMMDQMYDNYYQKAKINWTPIKTNPCAEHPMSVGGEL